MCGVADIVFARPLNLGELFAQGINDFRRVIHRQRRLSYKRKCRGITDIQRGRLVLVFNEIDGAAVGRVISPHCALNLRVASVSNQHTFAPRGAEGSDFDMHFGHQGAGCVKDLQAAAFRLILHCAGYTVSTENNDGIIRHFRKFIHEHSTTSAQIVHNMPVVHHFMSHVDGPTKDFEGAIHNINSAIDSGTESSRVSKNNIHQCSSAGSTCAIRTLKWIVRPDRG